MSGSKERRGWLRGGAALIVAGLAAGALLAAGAASAARKPPAGAQLGGLNLAAYCASMHKTVKLLGPVVGPHAGRNWRCGSSLVEMTDACRWSYPGTNAVSFLPDANNAFSWTCYAGAIEGTVVQCDLVAGAVKTDRCTVTVAGGAKAPTGAVQFRSASGGVFSVGDSCTLAPMALFANRASCSVEFLPATNAASSTITATYAGDAGHPASSGRTHIV